MEEEVLHHDTLDVCLLRLKDEVRQSRLVMCLWALSSVYRTFIRISFARTMTSGIAAECSYSIASQETALTRMRERGLVLEPLELLDQPPTADKVSSYNTLLQPLLG
jgi:hypothetical protein